MAFSRHGQREGRRGVLFTIFIISMMLAFTANVATGDVTVPVAIDYDRVAARTSEGFLSVTIDASEISRNFSGLDLQSEKMINIGKALAPGVFRFGGSAQDYITYNMLGHAVDDVTGHMTGVGTEHGRSRARDNNRMDRLYSTVGEETVMSREQWDYIYNYTSTVGLSLIFGLNSQKRSKDGSWNMTNARQLIEYTKSRGCKVNWELGNEPDLYDKHTGEAVVSAHQLARDFHALSQYLKSIAFFDVLAGPDVATRSRGHFFEEFLDSLKENEGPNAITWHQYYGSGRTFTLPDFHSAKILDKLKTELDLVQLMLSNADMRHAEVWLGETSSCYGGGVPGVSDSFVAGFMWLDKLGLTALYNYTHICRQTLWGGSYSLIDSKTNTPLPDFYASLAYKQLMSDKVLSVEGQLTMGRTMRVYAHCTRILPGSEYKAGSVTLMALNIDNTTSAQLRLASRFDHTVVAQYLFQPTDTTPTCKSVMLNRNPLSLINDKDVPELRPKLVVIPTEGTIQVPPLTYAFFVLPTANATACM